MKVIIAGSRDISCPFVIDKAIKESGFEVSELVSGGARGVDLLGEIWATLNRVPIMRFSPDWESLGRKAGILRNQEMADYGEALIAIWDGKSRGTKDMIDRATNKGLKVYVHKTQP